MEDIQERLERIERLLLDKKSVLTFDEVASYTGLSKSHLYKLTSSRGIPCYKPNGKKIYFDKKEVDAWLLQNRVATSKELETQAQKVSLAKNFGV